MIAHWYVYVTIAVIGAILSLICDKFKIIKSKGLRTVLIIFVSSLIAWVTFDVILGTE